MTWQEKHNAWEKVNEIYSGLFAIRQEQLRSSEEYELVLGLGLLTWQTPNEQHVRVRRHLIVADATLEFEAESGKFTVRAHTEGAKLRPELDMLDSEERPPSAENTARDSLTKAEDDPWNIECVKGVLKALVHSINPQGDYRDTLEAGGASASENPVVEYAPALILRKRNVRGLTETLRKIKEQMENGEDIPGEFARLAELEPDNDREAGEGPREPNNKFNEGMIFFPKPANDEQRRIVEKMRVSSGMLVQGPPGTGKSHTIANLICHLLATGQRILITAKTPRALQVLEGLVPEELRPLCISLLGRGAEERRSLEASVGGILRKHEEWNKHNAEQEREDLQEHLQKCREEKATVDRRLRAIREAEMHIQFVAEGAYTGTAAQIARDVNRKRSDYGWFSDSVPLHGTCPVSAQDIREVLMALRDLTPEIREELQLTWPNAVPSVECFKQLVKNEADAAEEEHNLANRADSNIAERLEGNDSATIKAIRDALSGFHDTRNRLTPPPWMNDALRDILGGNPYLWEELFHVTDRAVSAVKELVGVADETHVEFPDHTDIRDLYSDARILKQHIDNNGKLGWGLFRPKLVKERLYVIKAVNIDGHPCSTAGHFSTLTDVLRVRIEFKKAWDLWAERIDRVQGSCALQLAGLKSLCDALKHALSLRRIIDTCPGDIQECLILNEPPWIDEAWVERIIFSCRLVLARFRKRLAAETIQDIETPLPDMLETGNVHPVTEELLCAISNRDVKGFAQSVTRIEELEKQRQDLNEMNEKLSELCDMLPCFAERLEHTYDDPDWEERIQHINDAWHWAQARSWIEDYIRQEDVLAPAERAKQIEDEINDIIGKLAENHAWSFCCSRLEDQHRRHIVAWQHAMGLLGRGTGRYAPRHRRDAQNHLNQCREAIPAWIMPLHRVWDTVSPKPSVFDVIIVDESSQCGFEALPLLYLGKKILIVGDDKQISPDVVGLTHAEVHRLMDELLHDFRYKSSFDIESSLFDHGKLFYGNHQVTLREHFRCMPEIIRFSNDLCYSDTPLIPLRQYGEDRLPPLERVFVEGGYREGKGSRVINRPEAEAIVERIIQMCGDSRYDDKTMGVVILQGQAQAGLIENQLLERLGAEEMEQRRLICGNPYSFQGDERDIIFLSLVAAPNAAIGTLIKATDERRFNVAASRARDMMILFHSVTREDLSVHCLRRKLLEFFENKGLQQIAGIDQDKQDELERRAARDNRSAVHAPEPFDSWFEVDVALELLREGFTVHPQYPIAGRRIDLVIDGGQSRLAVECDGDHWHGADNYEADMQRQRQLERCGWKFFRVRESAFFFNKDDALAGLWQELEKRDILPNQPE